MGVAEWRKETTGEEARKGRLPDGSERDERKRTQVGNGRIRRGERKKLPNQKEKKGGKGGKEKEERENRSSLDPRDPLRTIAKFGYFSSKSKKTTT